MAAKKTAKKTPAKKTPAKSKKSEVKVDETLLSAATNLNEVMGLTGEDEINLEGTNEELKAGITNAAKFIEDSDTFEDSTWGVLEDLDLVHKPEPKKEAKKSKTKKEEAEEELEVEVGSTVSVDFDGEDLEGVVQKITKKGATVLFSDGDTDVIPVDECVVLSAPEKEEEAEEEEQEEEAPAKRKKKSKKASSKKKEEQEELGLEEEEEEEQEPVLEKGSRVSVDFDGEAYEGTVSKITKKGVTVDFDDGTSEVCEEAECILLPTEKRAKKAKSSSKKAKGSKKEKTPRAKREPGTPSNKEVVYKAWSKKKKSATAEELYELVEEAVQLSTIKSWIKAWANGKRLPACAK